MPYDGNGNYSVPAGTVAIGGTVISSVAYNTFLGDISTALSNQILRDGTALPTNNLPMGGYKLTNLAAGIAAGDSLRFEQLFSQGVPTPVASATTTDIGVVNSVHLNITGTTQIDSFGTNYNGPRLITFSGSLTLKYNATTLIIPGQADVVTQAGDSCIVAPKGNPADGWVVIAYQRAAGISGSGATGGGTDQVFFLNDQTVNNDYTIISTKNAHSAGPIAIANGKTVTVSNGAVWTII